MATMMHQLLTTGDSSSSITSESTIIDIKPSVSISKQFMFDGYSYQVLSTSLEKNNHPIISLMIEIDISGSMKGPKIAIVLHAVKAIIESSHDNLYIAFQTFDSKPEIICEFIQMTRENKDFLLRELYKIHDRGSTNLIDALKSVFISIQKTSLTCPIYVILLTDGEPDSKVISEYQVILEQNKVEGKFKIASLDIFGVGDRLDKKIIDLLTSGTNGCFYYITDETMVADIFAYYFANIKTTILFNGNLRFEIRSSIPDQEIITTGFIEKDSSNIYSLNVGNMQFSQTKKFLLKSNSPVPITIDSAVFTFTTNENSVRTLRYTQSLEEGFIPILIDDTSAIPEIMKYDIYELLSYIYTENIHQSTCPVDIMMRKLDIIYQKYSSFSGEPQIQKYLNDLVNDSDPNKGQIKRAIQEFIKWGNKYLWSLFFAYQKQITINDKDKSIQSFSGSSALLLIGDFYQTFSRIPFVGVQRADIDYSNVRGGSCFKYDSPVILKNGSVILINQIQSGMELDCGKVIYVIMSLCKEPLWKYSISSSEFVIGTKTHPVLINGSWIALIDCPGATQEESNPNGEYVYSLCIENSKSFKIRNIDVATIGHKIDDSQITTHGKLASTFWGVTILKILAKLNGEGLLEDNLLRMKSGDYFIRDGVFRKLQTPADQHPGQALLGSAENGCYALFYQGVTYK
jgi:uncharacterized protein YegL